MSDSKTARVHSFQSLGAVDGPGLRCVVFLQGCPYRCPYCHNPDTRPMDGGAENSVDALCDRLERYKSYFGKEGGVTVSGGEPLMQCAFLADFFAECHRRGITTCLDTAGMFPDDGVRAVLAHTDTVLCDIKHTDASVCRSSFGLSLDVTRQFLSACDEAGCCIRIRHVVVPGLTDGEEHIKALCSIARQYRNLEKIELLPFRKLCADKYKTLGIPFPLADTPECDAALLAHLNAVVSSVELGGNPDFD
ncbi:MAG: pyruvate formate lyase-activating protein [Ruminococcaceae bacterium]|nr:pyruvate formate lyase-activating protein [Oscillospiraceae bacterium]